MFVMTAKLSKTKLIAAGVVILAVILLIVLLASGGGPNQPAETAPIGATNDDRVAYLATFGWSVNAEPSETQRVKIPDTAENEVFSRYNDLQKSQGFDLTDFAGKEVMRYVYEILNYPDATDPVYASVLVYDGHVIGGDVTNSAPDGVIHGFSKPSPSSAGSTASTPSTEQNSTQTESTAETTTEAEQQSTED